MIIASRVRDWSLLVICNLIWGSQFAMSKLVQEQMEPAFASFFPMTLATLLLIPIVHRARQHEGAAGNRRHLTRRDLLDFVLMGVLGQVGAQLFVSWGVRLSLASNAALVVLALPVSTAVMAYFFLTQRMTRVRWLSFALAFAGVLECSGNQLEGTKLHEWQIPFGQFNDLYGNKRQRLLQCLRQEVAASLQTARGPAL